MSLRWFAVSLVVMAVGVVGFTILTDDPPRSGPAAATPLPDVCDDMTSPIPLVVAAPAEIAPALRTISEQAVEDHIGVEGRCVLPIVEAQSAAETAAAIGDESSTALPDVWIADSRTLLDETQGTLTGGTRLTGDAPVIARTPLVLAMSGPGAERAGWPDAAPTWEDVVATGVGDQPVILADPAVSTAGLGFLMTADHLLGDDPQGRRNLVAFIRGAAERAVADDAAALAAAAATDDAPAVPAREQAVVAYNADGPDRPLVAIYPGDSQLSLEYVLATLHQAPADASVPADEDTFRAALRFKQVVQSPQAQEVLAAAGFRGADGSPGGAVTRSEGVPPDRTSELAVDAGTSARAFGAWQAANLDAQILAVVDVSGSMAEEVSDGRTRLAVATSAADFAVSLFPDTSEFGLWSFSTELEDGGSDHVELAPTGALGDPVDGVPRSQAIRAALGAMVPTNGTSLYDTTLAAFGTAQLAYDAEKINSVVLLTDGVNDDETSITLDALLAELAAADQARPVQIMFVAIGPGVDVSILERIAAVTDGAVYQADEPSDIEQVFLDAIVNRQAAG